ncbi:type II toxin-antitoxin system HicB family antitoxin [candidate division KSB1 bacterium]|nr:type II toxin-antitoxin system HicB family antitoxin [candidate division KSB1 bacterium]
MKYVIVVEKSDQNYAAYVPDLPGCVAAAVTKEEVVRLIREAIELHVQSMRDDGLEIPEPAATSEYVEIA